MYYVAPILVALCVLQQTAANPLSAAQQPICHNSDGELVPMRGSCSGFYICIEGRAIASSCGNFYHFNELTRLCDHPALAACVLNEPPRLDDPVVMRPHPPTLPAPTTPTTVLALPKPKYPDEVFFDATAGAICAQQPTGMLLPKRATCGQYYVCIKQRPYKRTCPPQMHFNAARKLCQNPALAQCSEKSGAEELFNDADVCAGVAVNALVPHPRDCGKFFSCNQRKVKEMSCPEGLHFSAKKRRCEWPGLAKCDI